MKKFIVLSLVLTGFGFSAGSFKTDFPQLETQAPVTLTTSAELIDALPSLKEGSELIIKNGVYSFNKVLYLANLKGTAKSPIVIRAEGNGQVFLNIEGLVLSNCENVIFWGMVIGGELKGLSQLGKSHVSVEACRHVILSRCVIAPNDSVLDKANTKGTRYSFLVVGGGEDNQLTRCTFTNKTIMGPMVVIRPTEKRPTLEFNYFKDFAKGKLGNGYEGLQLGNDNRYRMRAVVRWNWFENMDGEPEVISVKTSENLIMENTFRNNQAECVVRAANGTRIYSNTFLRTLLDKNGVGGIRNQGDDTQILGNQLINLSSGIASQYGDTGVDMPDSDFWNEPLEVLKESGRLEKIYRQSRRVSVVNNSFWDVSKVFSFKAADTFNITVEGKKVAIVKDKPMSDWLIKGNFVVGTNLIFNGSGETNFKYEGNRILNAKGQMELGRDLPAAAWSIESSTEFSQGPSGGWQDSKGRVIFTTGIALSKVGNLGE